MKKHNLLKVTLLVLFLVVIGTWFLPVTVFNNGSFTTTESIKVGLFHLASYVGIVLQIFGPIIVYILSVGGLYGVLYNIPQYRILLDKIVDGFKGREWLFMTTVGVVFAALSSMAGLSIPLILLFPFVISIVLLMGYDKITAAMLVVGSTIAGLIGSVFSANDVYGLTRLFGSSEIEEASSIAVNIAKTDVLWKIALLVVALALVLVNTFIYAKKHKKENADLEKELLVPKKVKTSDKRVLPIAIVLGVLLVVLTLAFISWDILEIDLFDKLTNGFVVPTGSTFVKGLYGGLNTILGISVNDNINNTFGHWTIMEAALVVFLSSGLIAFLYRSSINKFVSSTEKGVKKALRPALLASIAYLIVVVIVTVPFELTILQHIIDVKGGFSLIVMAIIALFYSLLTVESYYGVVSAATYVGASTVLEGHVGVIALIWQSMYGLAMLVAPTSVLLLVTLSYLDITYTDWLKAVWKLFLELLVAIFIILLLFSM